MVVDFWFEKILERYISDINTDTIKSYNEIEVYCFQGPIGTYLKSLKLWIKMLVCEKGIMWMEHGE